MGKEKNPATSLTASVDDRMEKGMLPEIISWPVEVRRQFVIREASTVPVVAAFRVVSLEEELSCRM